MNIFNRINNESLDASFIEYAESFRNYLCREFGAEKSDFLSMIYSDKVSGSNISEFLEANNVNFNRTMMYLLLREYDIEVGIQEDPSRTHIIHRLFSSDMDHLYLNYENLSDFISVNGLAGLLGSFCIKDHGVKKELARLLYEDIKDYENFLGEDQLWSDGVLTYLSVAARHLIFNDEHQVRELNADSVYIPPSLELLSVNNFYQADQSTQERLIAAAFSDLNEIDKRASYAESNVGGLKLAIEWPSEYGRACLIAGDPVHDVIPRVAQLSGILLKRNGIPDEEVGCIVEILLKRMLFSFPDDFRNAFAIQPDIEHCLAANVIKNNDSDEINKILLGALKADFGESFFSMGSAHKFIALIKDNGYELDAAIPLLEMNNSGFATRALQSIIDDRAEIGENHVIKIVSKWLTDLKEADLLLNNRLAGATHGKIAILNDASLFSLYNECLLKSAIKSESLQLSNNNFSASFLFSGKESLEDFVSMLADSRELLTPYVIKLGKFTRHDFAPHWKKLSSEIKRSFAENDLGM